MILITQIIVGIISLAVIAVPLIWAFKLHAKGENSDLQVWMFLGALFWVGYTGARLIYAIGGGDVS